MHLQVKAAARHLLSHIPTVSAPKPEQRLHMYSQQKGGPGTPPTSAKPSLSRKRAIPALEIHMSDGIVAARLLTWCLKSVACVAASPCSPSLAVLRGGTSLSLSLSLPFSFYSTFATGTGRGPPHPSPLMRSPRHPCSRLISNSNSKHRCTWSHKQQETCIAVRPCTYPASM